MNIEKVQAALAAAQAPTKKVYAQTYAPRNETFAKLKLKDIPANSWDFRMLPPVEGKNEGMHLVNTIPVYKGQQKSALGSFNTYDYVMGSVSNPDCTFFDKVNAFWRSFERNQNDKYLGLPEHLQLALKKLRGENYFDVPCLFRAKQTVEEYEYNGRQYKGYKLTTPSEDNADVIGKIFQMSNADIYGRETFIVDHVSGKRVPTGKFDGILGILTKFRKGGESVDSLGHRGAWLTLTVQRPEKGSRGWPTFAVSVSPDTGALDANLVDKYMSEENYPDVPNLSKWMMKTNEEAQDMFVNSALYKELCAVTDWRVESLK